MGKIKVGVIGTGRIGKVHIENLVNRNSQADVTAIADVNESEVQKTALRFGIKNVYGSYNEILKSSEIDAVLICSSTNTHAQITQEAAKAGKHIFCEKPIDLSLERIKETIKVVEESGVKFMVGFNRRFDPNFLKVRETVGSGKIGKPHILKITSRDPEPPPATYIKVSGGLFLDMTIHDFDMARYLVGSEINEIYAKGGVLIDPVFEEEGDIDTAVTTLSFENGSIGIIDNSRKAAYGYDQRVEVFGSEGMIAVDNNTPDTHIRFDKSGAHKSLPLYFFMQRYTESYLQEINSFVKCIMEGADVPVGGKDGLLSVVAGLAAKKSIIENRPIKLKEIL